MGSYKSYNTGRIMIFQTFSYACVIHNGRGAGIYNYKIVATRLLNNLFDTHIGRWCINETAFSNKPGWIGEPSGIPEGADLAPRLVSCTSSTVKPTKKWRVK